MATPIAGGVDALTIPSASAVASTNTAQLNWNSQGYINTNMSFYGGYVGVVTNSTVSTMNAAGVAVFLFCEQSQGGGPQGALGYTPVNPAYFTYGQGVYDGGYARSNCPSVWPSTTCIYYTTDFSSTSANVAAITAYMQGVASVDSYAGLYGNGGTLNALSSTGYVKYYCQNESLGEWNNSTLQSITSLWQVYNGGHLSLSNGSTNIDGELAFQATGQTTGDYGQYPFSFTPPPTPGSGSTTTQTSTASTSPRPFSPLNIQVPN